MNRFTQSVQLVTLILAGSALALGCSRPAASAAKKEQAPAAQQAVDTSSPNATTTASAPVDKSGGFSASFDLPPTAPGASSALSPAAKERTPATAVASASDPPVTKPQTPATDVKPPTLDQLPKGVVLYLTFNFDTLCKRDGKLYVRDTSGKGNDFELQNNAKLVEGRFGAALQTEAADYATGSDAALPTGSAPITVSTWLKPRRTAFQIFWSYGTTEPGQARGLSILDRESVCFFSGEDSCHTKWAEWKANEWQHVVATFADGEARFFLDGKLYATTPGKFDTKLGRMTVSRSLYPTSPSQYTGLIDELTIFDRALSADEVKSLFELAPYSSASLVSIIDAPACK